MSEPKVWTTIECDVCFHKAIRPFKLGDYVFKILDYPCPYCIDNDFTAVGRPTIVAIWRDDSREVAE